jgi:hypothetical protein
LLEGNGGPLDLAFGAALLDRRIPPHTGDDFEVVVPEIKLLGMQGQLTRAAEEGAALPASRDSLGGELSGLRVDLHAGTLRRTEHHCLRAKVPNAPRHACFAKV